MNYMMTAKEYKLIDGKWELMDERCREINQITLDTIIDNCNAMRALGFKEVIVRDKNRVVKLISEIKNTKWVRDFKIMC